MVTIEGNVEWEVQDAIVRRKVISPQERLATQLDTYGEEAEQRPQQRQLNKHRQTTTHRADTSLLVDVHHLLLLLHCILLTGVLRIQGIHLGLDNAHLGSREVALICQGEDQELNQDGQDKDDDTEVSDVVAQEIEYGDYNPAVKPADKPATERNQTLHSNTLTIGIHHVRQYCILVRTAVE